MNEAEKNADRFFGFADTYDEARPAMPLYPIEIITRYLNKKPDKVVDLGSGTGLSTLVWKNNCNEVIGIEPSGDMLRVSEKKQTDGVTFKKAFSHDTGLPDNSYDVVICSQSFHWMEPLQTLAEVNRILKTHGIFATVDCDWPPVCNWIAEKAYEELFSEIKTVEKNNPELKEKFTRWDKNKHLENIKKSGYFNFSREIVFSNKEKCNAERFIKLALSQGGLQSILKTNPNLILSQVEKFKDIVLSVFNNNEVEIDFSYRMRIGIK